MKHARGSNKLASIARNEARDYAKHWTPKVRAFAHLLAFGPKPSRRRSGRPHRANKKPNFPVFANNPIPFDAREQSMERRKRGGWYQVRKRSVFPEAS